MPTSRSSGVKLLYLSDAAAARLLTSPALCDSSTSINEKAVEGSCLGSFRRAAARRSDCVFRASFARAVLLGAFLTFRFGFLTAFFLGVFVVFFCAEVEAAFLGVVVRLAAARPV